MYTTLSEDAILAVCFILQKKNKSERNTRRKIHFEIMSYSTPVSLKSIKTTQKKIHKLVEEISTLTIHLDDQIKRLDINRKKSKEHDFEVGDWVSITNNYRGLFGEEGEIKKVSRGNATVELKKSKKTIQKKKTNLKKIPTNSSPGNKSKHNLII